MVLGERRRWQCGRFASWGQERRKGDLERAAREIVDQR